MGKTRKFEVHLSPEQRQHLQSMTRKGYSAARVIIRCQALLLADEDHAQGQRPDAYIVQATGIKLRTLVRLRKQFAQEGLAAALQRKVRSTPPVAPKITGRIEAKLITLACSEAPAGQSRWTTKLLAESMTRLKYISSISRESVRRALKKTNLSLGVRNASASPKRIDPASFLKWKPS